MGWTITKTDLAALLAGLILLVMPVIAQTTRSTEASHRSVCAANLRGISQSMNVYAADNNDAYPMLPAPNTATAFDATFKNVPTEKEPASALATLYGKKMYPGNPSANLWIMVLTGQVAPKQFICPSDELAAKPATAIDEKSEDRGYFLNFQNEKNISYSSAYPWLEANGKTSVASLWRNQTDASLPLLSDMAPYLGSKAKEGQAATRPADSKPTDPVDANWAVTKANSQNHQFDGENIGFGDAHAEFARNPAAGQNNDSIWGIWKNAGMTQNKEIPIEAGTLPHSPAGTQGNYDVVMVPTRDSKGNLTGTKISNTPTEDLP